MGSYVQLGVDVSKVWASATDPGQPTHAEGDRHVGDDGTTYIYTKAHGTITNGTRHNVLTTKITSANGSGAWLNNTGASVLVGDRYWAKRYIGSSIITE